MAIVLKKTSTIFAILVSFACFLPLCSAAVSGSVCNPNTDGATVCSDVDGNAECPAGTTNCACKDGYKEGPANTNTCVLMAVSDIDCNPTTDGATVCSDKDVNAECPDGTKKCTCKHGYKEGPANTNTCVLMAVSDFTCNHDSDDQTTGGAAVCTAVDTNAECPEDGTTCKCKSGYQLDKTDVNTCVKVLGKACSTDDECFGLVANSVCSSPQNICKCKATFTEESAVCKTAGSTKPSVSDTACDHSKGGDALCKGIDTNAECPDSTTKCACKTDYFFGSDKTCVQKITTVGCTPDDNTEGTTKCQKVDVNSECPVEGDKCACKDGYSGTDSCTKDAGSSATSAWMTTSLIAMSLLMYLPRLIYG